MPSEKDNILKFNHCMKSDKMPQIIYADIEFLIKTLDGSPNKTDKFSTTKVDQHIPCRYSISTILAFDCIENKHTLHRGGDCMKKFCESLREDAKNMINFERKEKTKFISRCKIMLQLWKKNLKKACKK